MQNDLLTYNARSPLEDHAIVLRRLTATLLAASLTLGACSTPVMVRETGERGDYRPVEKYVSWLIERDMAENQIESCGRRTPICEIELELLSGKVDDIFNLTRLLQKDLDLFPAIASKAERGYALFLNEPLHPFKSKPVPINERQTPIEAFRSIALGCLEHFQRNEKGLMLGGEAEFIHQARVALRRLRSAIKLFAPVLPPEFVAAYGQTWQTLAGALGDTRNWDVFLEETLPPIAAAFPDNRDIKRLRKAAQRRASSSRKSVIGLLAVKEYPRLLLEFTAAVYTLSDTLPMPIKDFAQQQIRNHGRKARRMANRHAELTPEERHKMRIAFKKLRYTLEFFTPLLPQRRLRPYLAALSQIQDELGLINDHLTAETLIAEALDGRPHGPIHGWISGRHALLVSELPEVLQTWLAQRAPSS